MESLKNIERELFMNEKFTKDIINQLFVLMRESENSEEIGVNFTIDKNVVSVGIDEENTIDKDWLGGSCEYEFAINFRDWTDEEKFLISMNIDTCFFRKSKGDINYYDSSDNDWKFLGNIYEMNDNEKVGGITRVKTTEPTEEKRYRILLPEEEIILNMNKSQYEFFVKLFEETELLSKANFFDLQGTEEITM